MPHRRQAGNLFFAQWAFCPGLQVYRSTGLHFQVRPVPMLDLSVLPAQVVFPRLANTTPPSVLHLLHLLDRQNHLSRAVNSLVQRHWTPSPLFPKVARFMETSRPATASSGAPAAAEKEERLRRKVEEVRSVRPRLTPRGSRGRQLRYWVCSLHNRGCPFSGRLVFMNEDWQLVVTVQHDLSVHAQSHTQSGRRCT